MAQSENSKYMQTLSTYPAMTAVAGLIASFPVPKIFFSNAIPLLHAISQGGAEAQDAADGEAAEPVATE